MTYELVISESIRGQIDQQVSAYLEAGASHDVVAQWLAGLSEKLSVLRSFPRVAPVARWPSTVVGDEIRRLTYGEHVVFYRVDDKSQRVLLLSFRHGRRRPWLQDGTGDDHI